MAGLLLGAEIVFYARMISPVGASTWGSRYTTTPVILLSMLAVPMTLTRWTLLSLCERILTITVISLAISVQMLSVIFWCMLEEAQMHDIGSGFVIGMRLVNVLGIGLGKLQNWHLVTPEVTPRYLTLNFTPFLMAKYISTGFAHKLQLAWCFAVVVALVAGVRLTWFAKRIAGNAHDYN